MVLVGENLDGTKQLLGIKFDETTVRLTDADIAELSGQLYCEYKNCIYTSWSGKTVLMNDIDLISTGIIRDIAIRDQSGQILGTSQTFLAITRAADGQPRLLDIILQIETIDNPAVNILDRHVFGVGGETVTTKVYTHEELQEIVARGKQYTFGVEVNPQHVTTYPGHNYVIDHVYGLQGYIDLLKNFFDSIGQTAPSSEPLLIYCSRSRKR